MAVIVNPMIGPEVGRGKRRGRRHWMPPYRPGLRWGRIFTQSALLCTYYAIFRWPAGRGLRCGGRPGRFAAKLMLAFFAALPQKIRRGQAGGDFWPQLWQTVGLFELVQFRNQFSALVIYVGFGARTVSVRSRLAPRRCRAVEIHYRGTSRVPVIK
ncbi:MAG: hypothetical protein KF778_16685 [Rhodocyclaceae bacterium]|nr:hypothetical protein [Rhodocyclaceae bacterium]MBX3670039.1 hypothetical protein [Rhodocyclaceae bacterium]